MAYEYFRKVALFLKKSKLAPEPVSILRVKLRDTLDGQCELKDDKFIIKINRKLPENYSVDVLLHEIAHAVAWDKDTDVHGPNWGKAYSKVYRLYLEKFIENQ